MGRGGCSTWGRDGMVLAAAAGRGGGRRRASSRPSADRDGDGDRYPWWSLL